MQNAINHIRSELSAYYNANELQSIVRLLISNITGFNFTEILVNKNTIFSAYQWDLLNIYLEKLKTGMPVQYVLGETEFCGLSFRVDKSVLIPRPETEELVEWIVKETGINSMILDIGTGSGCIAIALKHFMPQAVVYACDVSLESLQTARVNAELNETKVDFFYMDILEESNIDNRYNVIVSNPPYIPYVERIEIADHVK
ncbi:MAG: peptide chain release factor N(5)-glutamine methyltransferase, partial [Paludibacter sp.]|nr:peptide chain release factor N(5)-glutamine methyltransferase [Paludibacter sp.]